MFISHVKDDRIQTVEAHCNETAEIAKTFANNLGTEVIAYLSGLLHDTGKMCEDFNLYITKQKNFSRGQIDHSYVGAKYLTELADGNASLYEISRFIGRIISAHHGLQDNYDENGTDRFKQRISKDERYAEICGNIGSITDDKNIEQLLQKANAEYSEVKKELYDLSCKITDKKIQKTAYAFYLGFFERLMLSILIDADRTNTANFMSGTTTELKADHNALWLEMEKKLNKKLDEFSHMTDKISLQRRSISQRCYEAAIDILPPIAIINKKWYNRPANKSQDLK